MKLSAPIRASHRAEQHRVQVGAVDREMRPLVAGGEPPRLAIDQLAVAREERVVLRLARNRRELVLQAERAQLLDRVRPEIDADAERKNFGCGLEHADAARGAAGMHGQRQRQPADAASDDDDVHVSCALRGVKLSGRVRAGNLAICIEAKRRIADSPGQRAPRTGEGSSHDVRRRPQASRRYSDGRREGAKAGGPALQDLAGHRDRGQLRDLHAGRQAQDRGRRQADRPQGRADLEGDAALLA